MDSTGAEPYVESGETDGQDQLDQIRFYVENYDRLCRLCLTNERLVNVYSNVQGRNVFYVRNFIKEALRILEQTIDKKDKLPNFICEKCERNLNIIFNFKKKCDNSRRILEKVRDKTIVPEDLIKSEENSQVENVVHSRGKAKNSAGGSNCEDILKKLPQDINIEKVRDTTAKRSEPLATNSSTAVTTSLKVEEVVIKQEVPTLGLLFPDTELNLDLQEIEHLVQDGPQKQENSNSNSDSEGGADYLDDQDSDSDWNPDEGQPDEEQPDAVAGEEELLIKIKKEPLAIRKERKSKGTKMVKQLGCEKLPKEKTVCAVCGALVNNIKCHMVIHEEIRPHQCEHCPKNFTSRNKLQSHINSVHLKKRDFKCEICGKAFLEKNNLKGHQRIHKGDRKYKCDLCPKSFLFAGTLRYHTLTHTQDKKHECQVCGKMFLMRTTLTKHLQVHSNERPHRCELCDKAFRTSTHLRVHMRTHTGEKPLHCRICGIGFAHHKARSVHMKTKHAEELIAMDMIDERGYLKF